MLSICCKACNSTDIAFGAWIKWDVENNSLRLDETFDQAFCENCKNNGIPEGQKLTNYTPEEALNAICVIELIHTPHYLDRERLFNWLREGEGICYARDTALLLAPKIEKAWKRARESGFDDPFDWVFLPKFLSILIGVCGPNPRDNCSNRMVKHVTEFVVKEWLIENSISCVENDI